MTTTSGPAADAKLQRLREATRAYAGAWAYPLWPASAAGALALLGIALVAWPPATQTRQLLLVYTPLLWALAHRFASRRFIPPHGADAAPRFIDGFQRYAASLLLVLVNVAFATWAPGLLQPHVAVATLGALLLVWTARPWAGPATWVTLAAFGALSPAPSLDVLALAAVNGAALLLSPIFAGWRRRTAARMLARATAEMGTAERQEAP